MLERVQRALLFRYYIMKYTYNFEILIYQIIINFLNNIIYIVYESTVLSHKERRYVSLYLYGLRLKLKYIVRQTDRQTDRSIAIHTVR